MYMHSNTDGSMATEAQALRKGWDIQAANHLKSAGGRVIGSSGLPLRRGVGVPVPAGSHGLGGSLGPMGFAPGVCLFVCVLPMCFAPGKHSRARKVLPVVMWCRRCARVAGRLRFFFCFFAAGSSLASLPPVQRMAQVFFLLKSTLTV
jgi:hypothetical protein